MSAVNVRVLRKYVGGLRDELEPELKALAAQRPDCVTLVVAAREFRLAIEVVLVAINGVES